MHSILPAYKSEIKCNNRNDDSKNKKINKNKRKFLKIEKFLNAGKYNIIWKKSDLKPGTLKQLKIYI